MTFLRDDRVPHPSLCMQIADVSPYVADSCEGFSVAQLAFSSLQVKEGCHIG